MTESTFWQGFWRLADPKISLASFAGLWLGACAAGADYHISWAWLGLTVLGIFCVEVAKNASGEVVDYDSGTDLDISEKERTPFSGGKRVLVDKLLTRKQTWQVATFFYLMAITIGLAMVMLVSPNILFFGLAGMTLAWCYHAAPVRLAYRGLGEVAVALAYGPLVVCGTYYVQTGTLSTPLLHVSGALGLQVAAFLWINQFPDYRADLAAGKRNLVVRQGIEKASFTYITIIASAYLWLALAGFVYTDAAGYLWGFAGLPLAAFSAWRAVRNSPEDISSLVPAQAAALGGFVLMAFGAGVGYLLTASGS